MTDLKKRVIELYLLDVWCLRRTAIELLGVACGLALVMSTVHVLLMSLAIKALGG